MWILAFLDLALLPHNVVLLTIPPYVPVLKAMKEIHFTAVRLSGKRLNSHLKIHVYHHLVDQMRIVEWLGTGASVLVAPLILATHLTVAQNV